MITTLLPSACSPIGAPPRDALPDAHQVGAGLRRGVGQVDGVTLGDDQPVAAGERADVEDGEVVVVLVDADGGGLPSDDGAEHTGQLARLTGRQVRRLLHQGRLSQADQPAEPPFALCASVLDHLTERDRGDG